MTPSWDVCAADAESQTCDSNNSDIYQGICLLLLRNWNGLCSHLCGRTCPEPPSRGRTRVGGGRRRTGAQCDGRRRTEALGTALVRGRRRARGLGLGGSVAAWWMASGRLGISFFFPLMIFFGLGQVLL
jgi:hypothetical protein